MSLGQRQAHYVKMPNNTGETDEASSNTSCWLYLPENEDEIDKRAIGQRRTAGHGQNER